MTDRSHVYWTEAVTFRDGSVTYYVLHPDDEPMPNTAETLIHPYERLEDAQAAYLDLLAVHGVLGS